MKRILPFVLLLSLLVGCQSEVAITHQPPTLQDTVTCSPFPTALTTASPITTEAVITTQPLTTVAGTTQSPVTTPAVTETQPITTPTVTTTDAITTWIVTTEQSSEPPKTVEPSDEDFVRIIDYIPDALIDLRYATDNNFTGERIYTFEDAWLRYGTVKKLAQAAEILREQGYRLLIWDAFRPTDAQWKLWSICPDPIYVSNPNKGYSSHSRGNTVDISIVTADGSVIEMPTGFDDFTPAADRDYSDVSEEAAKNALLLEKVMSDCDFKPYFGEWWHYSDRTVYDVEKAFLSEET